MYFINLVLPFGLNKDNNNCTMLLLTANFMPLGRWSPSSSVRAGVETVINRIRRRNSNTNSPARKLISR